MADLKILLGFDVDDSDIRKVQADIRRNIEKIEPQITVGLAGGAASAIRKELESKGLTGLALSELRASPSTLNELRESVKESLNVEFNPRVKTFDAQAALRNLRRELDKELEKLVVAVDLEQRRGGPSQGGKALPQATIEGADDLGLSKKGNEVKAQRIAIEQRVNSLLRGEEVLLTEIVRSDLAGSQAILEKSYKNNADAQDAVAGGARKNFEAIQKINRITERYEQGAINATQRLNQLSAIRINESADLAGQALERLSSSLIKARADVEQTAAAEDLLATITSELNASRRRGIEAEKEAEAVTRAGEAAQIEVRKAATKNASAFNSLTDIIGRVNRQELSYEEAVREATRLRSAAVPGSSTNAQIAREFDAQQEEVIKDLKQRAIAEKKAAADLKAGEATQIEVRKAATANARASRSLKEIQDKVAFAELSYEEAVREATRLRSTAVPGSSVNAEIARAFDAEQETVVADLKQRAIAEKAATDAAKKLAESQRNVQKQASASNKAFGRAAKEGGAVG